MIIWLNGAFGVGKTSVALGLQNKISNSFVFNPEDIGACIRNSLPSDMYKDDYQDYDIWREFCYKQLKYIDSNFDKTIIVPMTITNQLYIDEITGKLLSDGIAVKHYILNADKSTILARLSTRGVTDTEWPARQIDRCMDAFNGSIDGTNINTDNKSLDEIIIEIIEQSQVLL